MQKEDKNSVGLVETKYYEIKEKIKLENGVNFGPITVAYETYGNLNDEKDNVILLIHALTGDAHAAGYHSKEDKGINFLLGKGVVSVDKSAGQQAKKDSGSKANAYTVKVNGKDYAVKFENGKAIVNGKTYDVSMTEGIKEKSSSSHSGEGTAVNAPMPGNVLKIAVSEGDSVNEGCI